MKTSLSVHESMPVLEGGSAGCHEDKPVHESMPVHEGIQQATMKKGQKIQVKFTWQAAKKESQYST